jgi:hypothetical protein
MHYIIIIRIYLYNNVCHQNNRICWISRRHLIWKELHEVSIKGQSISSEEWKRALLSEMSRSQYVSFLSFVRIFMQCAAKIQQNQSKCLIFHIAANAAWNPKSSFQDILVVHVII